MKLNNTELNNYIGRVKLSRENKRKYKKQIDYLITEIRKSIHEDTNSKVKKVLQSGSWRKGTILRPRDGIDLDIDLVFFMEMGSQKEVNRLLDMIIDFLQKTYPNKDQSDFQKSKKSVNVVFRNSGLNVDIVPVIPIDETDDYVWQPEDGGKGEFITSINQQLAFNRDVKVNDPNYTAVVRMIKKWKKEKELRISSFAIELIAAHLNEIRNVAENIEDSVIRFFELLSRDGFWNDPVTFEGAVNNTSFTDSPVYVADPSNNENNVMERVSQEDWDEIVEEATAAFETLTWAQTKRSEPETLKLWKQVFGSTFNIDPMED